MICSTIMVAFCSLISRIAFVINSSGLFLNMAKVYGRIPARIFVAERRVNFAPSAILPTRSYFTALPSARARVYVLLFSAMKLAPFFSASEFISSCCWPVVTVYCSFATNILSSILSNEKICIQQKLPMTS